MMRKLAIVAVLLVGLTGCMTLNPKLEKAAMPVPSAYAAAQAGEKASLHPLPWRQVFKDQQLVKLIECSLENNRDLRIAMLNVEALRAQYRIQHSAQFPSIDANLQLSRQKTKGSDSSDGYQFKQYSANAALTSFEVDLFGRLRSMSEAASERYLAGEEGRQAAQIALIGAVADAYLTERLAEEQLKLTQDTLNDWRDSLRIAERLQTAAQASRLDVEQARGAVYRTEAELEARKRALLQAGNALTLLVGKSLPANAAPASPFMKMAIMTQLPAGLPSDLLANRPDIRRAEHELIASNADIGAARAAFLPQISLTAAAGFANPKLAGLFAADHETWSFTPQITQPIFHWGKLKGELDVTKVRKQIAVQEYERTIQTAFREVSDGLAARATYAQQLNAQAAAVASAAEYLRLSELRYQAGVVSRLELLDAQRTCYAAQQAQLDAQFEEYSSAAGLYRAIGGGVI